MPAAFFAAMSALKSAAVLPPSRLDRVGSRVKLMAPGRLTSASVLLVAGEDVVRQIPGGGFVGPLEVVPLTEAPYAEQLPAASHARTLKLYIVLGLRPVAVHLVTLPTFCAISVPRTTS